MYVVYDVLGTCYSAIIIPVPLKASLLKASPADVRKICVCVRLHSENSEHTMLIYQRFLRNTPRRQRLADGQLSSLYPPSPNFSSLGAASVMFCWSAPPAFSSTPLQPSVHPPTISLIVNTICIQTFSDFLNALDIFDQTDLYRFKVRLELYGASARLVVSPPSFSSSHPPTPPTRRWPALITLSPQVSAHLKPLV